MTQAVTPAGALQLIQTWGVSGPSDKGKAYGWANASAFVAALSQAPADDVNMAVGALRGVHGCGKLADQLQRNVNAHRRTLKARSVDKPEVYVPPDGFDVSQDTVDVFDTVGKQDPTPKSVVRNVVAVLEHDPKWKGRVRYNQFSYRAEIDGVPLEDHHALGLMDHCSKAYRLHLGLKPTTHAMVGVARGNPYNPVTDYLESLKWEGEIDCSQFLVEYCSAPVEGLVHVYSQNFLISAVARAFDPGCKVDTMLVFVDPRQGTGKSSAIKALCHDVRWFSDAHLNLSSQFAATGMMGIHLYELAELTSTSKVDVEKTKNFLSQATNQYRHPHAVFDSYEPRTTVFVGTTNEVGFLLDTANRRFWPVLTGDLDVQAIKRDRDQLWAHAVHLYKAGLQWHLTPEEEALQVESTKPFELGDGISEAIKSHFSRNPPIRALTLHEIYVAARLSDTGIRLDQGQKLGRSLQAAGFTRKHTSKGNLWTWSE